MRRRCLLLNQFFQVSDEALMVTDAKKRIIEVNDAFIEMSGYSRKEIMGKTPAILSSGRHDESFYKKMWETIETTGTWQGEIWDRKKNGEIYPKWMSIIAVKNDSKPCNYVSISTDISRIKHSQER